MSEWGGPTPSSQLEYLIFKGKQVCILFAFLLSKSFFLDFSETIIDYYFKTHIFSLFAKGPQKKVLLLMAGPLRGGGEG